MYYCVIIIYYICHILSHVIITTFLKGDATELQVFINIALLHVDNNHLKWFLEPCTILFYFFTLLK